MHEQLLGYLLNALEPDEQAALEHRLAADARLRQDLDSLRQAIAPLAWDAENDDPPAALAQRTCTAIYETCRPVPSSTLPSSTLPATGKPAEWRLRDLVVATGVAVASLLLVLPGVQRVRSHARVASCKENMRQLGLAFHQYSDLQGGYFPFVPSEGAMAFAGVYGPKLAEFGLLPDPRVVLCPSCSLSDDPDYAMPTVQELVQAEEQDLPKLQRRAGGSFGYTLGHLEGDRYYGTRNARRANFALLGDCPCVVPNVGLSAVHGGRGQNVLFEDGSVRFITCCQLPCGDELFQNEDGLQAPGLNEHDTVIVPGTFQLDQTMVQTNRH